MSRPHAHSTAATKVARRRENWGTANPVRPTHRRSYFDPGHLPPRSGFDRYGNPWRGTSNPPKPKRRTSWRDWYRETFLSMWRAERERAADADRSRS